MPFGIGSFLKENAPAVLNPVAFVTGKLAGAATGSEDVEALVNPIGAATEFALSDPLDFSGSGAEQNAKQINAILKQSAEAGIALNESQLAEIERLTAPFRTAATGTALPNLSALAFGGDIDFNPSQLFNAQLEQGREGILQGQAAGPGIKSSSTFGKLSDLVSGLAAEDIGRFESGQASLLEAGRGAEAGLSSAGTRLSGNIGDILSNLGAGQSATAQGVAQQRRASGQTLSSGLSGLSQLLLT